MTKTLHKYPKSNAVYPTLDDDLKLCFIAALQGDLFIRDQRLQKKTAELATAAASADTRSVFELTI